MSRKSIRIGLEELSRRNLQLNRFDPPAPLMKESRFLGPPRNKKTPLSTSLQKVGPPVPESHKNWGPCFTSPRNAVVLLFLDLFRLLWR
jgi:hypothetical protein